MAFFFFFDGTGRGVFFLLFFEGRDGTVVFGGGNFFGGTGQNRYTVPPKAVLTVPPAVHVKPWLLPSGNPFKCHEEVLYFQLLIPPKRFDIFSP